jgi:hypothetical protein
MNCKDCNSPKLFRFTVCKSCFYTSYCSFCKTLTLKQECLGHTVNTPTNNRFVADEQFISEALMDVSQD